MSELGIHRADCSTHAVRDIEIATAQLIAAVRDPDAGCKYCAARKVARAFAVYCRLRRPGANFVKGWRAHVHWFLADEPSRTTCRRCLRRRERVRIGEVPGCATHAQCSTCAPPRQERLH